MNCIGFSKLKFTKCQIDLIEAIKGKKLTKSRYTDFSLAMCPPVMCAIFVVP